MKLASTSWDDELDDELSEVLISVEDELLELDVLTPASVEELDNDSDDSSLEPVDDDDALVTLTSVEVELKEVDELDEVSNASVDSDEALDAELVLLITVELEELSLLKLTSVLLELSELVVLISVELDELLWDEDDELSKS